MSDLPVQRISAAGAAAEARRAAAAAAAPEAKRKEARRESFGPLRSVPYYRRSTTAPTAKWSDGQAWEGAGASPGGGSSNTPTTRQSPGDTNT